MSLINTVVAVKRENSSMWGKPGKNEREFEAGEDLKKLTAHTEWAQVPHFTTERVTAEGLHD